MCSRATTEQAEPRPRHCLLRGGAWRKTKRSPQHSLAVRRPARGCCSPALARRKKAPSKIGCCLSVRSRAQQRILEARVYSYEGVGNADAQAWAGRCGGFERAQRSTSCLGALWLADRTCSAPCGARSLVPARCGRQLWLRSLIARRLHQLAARARHVRAPALGGAYKRRAGAVHACTRAWACRKQAVTAAVAARPYPTAVLSHAWGLALDNVLNGERPLCAALMGSSKAGK